VRVVDEAGWEWLVIVSAETGFGRVLILVAVLKTFWEFEKIRPQRRNDATTSEAR
jgi:hypothetical protein